MASGHRRHRRLSVRFVRKRRRFGGRLTRYAGVAGEVEIRSTPRPGFGPRIVNVEPGGTVRWSVYGHRHDTTAYHPDNDRPQRIPDDVEPWASGSHSGNSTFEWTFDVEGVYDYADTRTLCTSHETLGAVSLVVGWSELETEPAIVHDADELPGRGRNVTSETCAAIGSLSDRSNRRALRRLATQILRWPSRLTDRYRVYWRFRRYRSRRLLAGGEPGGRIHGDRDSAGRGSVDPRRTETTLRGRCLRRPRLSATCRTRVGDDGAAFGRPTRQV